MTVFLPVALFVIVGDLTDAAPAIIIFMPIIRKHRRYLATSTRFHMGVVI